MAASACQSLPEARTHSVSSTPGLGPNAPRPTDMGLQSLYSWSLGRRQPRNGRETEPLGRLFQGTLLVHSSWTMFPVNIRHQDPRIISLWWQRLSSGALYS